MKVFLSESIDVEKVYINTEDGEIVVQKDFTKIEKGVIQDVAEVTNFDANNKNIRLLDNSTLMKVPNDKIVISGDKVSKNNAGRKKGGCGGCAKKRKQLEERRARNGS